MSTRPTELRGRAAKTRLLRRDRRVDVTGRGRTQETLLGVDPSGRDARDVRPRRHHLSGAVAGCLPEPEMGHLIGP